MAEAQGAVFDAADRYRKDLLDQDREASSALIQRYAYVWKRTREDLAEITAAINLAQAQGKVAITPTPGGGVPAKGLAYPREWIQRQAVYAQLLADVEAEVREFSQFANAEIKASQATMIQMATDHAHGLVVAGLAETAPGITTEVARRLDPDTFRQMIGMTEDGPLKNLLDQLPLQARMATKMALLDAVGRGINPEAAVRRAQAGTLSRAVTIARTESLRAYREVTRRTYQAADNVVRGWVWHSARNLRTCAACWAMHGTEHPVTERLNDHPRGRCAMVPLTATWEDLGLEGLPSTQPYVENGEALFAALSNTQKLAILGPRKLNLYRDGELKLADLVGMRQSDAWGSMRYERSLKEIQEGRNPNAFSPVPEKPVNLPDLAEPEEDYVFGRLSDLKVNREMSEKLGGVHRTKEVYDAPDGSRWLFKPQEEVRNEVDVAVAKIMAKTGFKTPDVFRVRLGDRDGSLQFMYPDARNRFGDHKDGFLDPKRIKPKDMEALEEHSVLDWLISNHDSHQEQYIRVAGDATPFVGIDKTQAFKFFPNDRLDYDYDPNANLTYNGGSVYNRIWKAWAKGEDLPGFGGSVDDPTGPAFRAIKRIMQMPNDEYREILRPLANARHRKGGGDPEQFLDAAVDRKRTLLTDFDVHYLDLAQQRQKALDAKKPKLTPTPGQPAGLKGMNTSTAHYRPKGDQWSGSQDLDRGILGTPDGQGVKTAIRDYTGSAYNATNEAMSGRRAFTPAVRKTVDSIQGWMQKNKLTTDVIVLRGQGSLNLFRDVFQAAGVKLPDMRITPTEVDRKGIDVTVLKGRIVEIPNFISTGYGFSFGGNVQIRIRMNAGSRAANIRHLSGIPNENEILVDGGQSFFIHDIRLVGHGYDAKVEIDMEVLPEGHVAQQQETARERKNRLERERYAKKKAAEEAAKQAAWNPTSYGNGVWDPVTGKAL